MQIPSTTHQPRTLLERLQGASLVGGTPIEALYRHPGGTHTLVAWIRSSTCRFAPVSPAEALAWARLNLSENEFQKFFPQGGESR